MRVTNEQKHAQIDKPMKTLKFWLCQKMGGPIMKMYLTSCKLKVTSKKMWKILTLKGLEKTDLKIFSYIVTTLLVI